MQHTAKWNAEVYLFEQDGETKADAVLHTGANTLHGYGTARCHTGEPDVPEIGDELAVGRAFADLGRKLIGASAEDLGRIEGHPVHLRR